MAPDSRRKTQYSSDSIYVAIDGSGSYPANYEVGLGLRF
jgi:hypothetical protein